MKKTVLTFGLVSGGFLAALMAVMVPACLNGTLDFDDSELVGYTTMVLAFLSVFFGIRSYRENVGGGAISFGRAFKVGLLITVISSAVYVAAWEVVYYGFFPDFGEKYGAHVIAKMRREGADPARLAAEEKKMARFKELYRNPFFNVGMTFLEVLPVGTIVALVSAGILRRKTPTPGSPSGAAATTTA